MADSIKDPEHIDKELFNERIKTLHQLDDKLTEFYDFEKVIKDYDSLKPDICIEKGTNLASEFPEHNNKNQLQDFNNTHPTSLLSLKDEVGSILQCNNINIDPKGDIFIKKGKSDESNTPKITLTKKKDILEK